MRAWLLLSTAVSAAYHTGFSSLSLIGRCASPACAVRSDVAELLDLFDALKAEQRDGSSIKPMIPSLGLPQPSGESTEFAADSIASRAKRTLAQQAPAEQRQLQMARMSDERSPPAELARRASPSSSRRGESANGARRNRCLRRVRLCGLACSRQLPCAICPAMSAFSTPRRAPGRSTSPRSQSCSARQWPAAATPDGFTTPLPSTSRWPPPGFGRRPTRSTRTCE